MPELIRKFFVSLKRKPQNIALVSVTVAFMWYSFNLSMVSFTTTHLQGNNMGLTGFTIMLFSSLAILCCLNAFPYRRKVNVLMLVLLFVLLAIVLLCDLHFLRCIRDKLAQGVVSQEDIPSVMKTRTIMIVHMALVAVAVALAATLPLYRKAIRRINTSVEVAGNAEMGTVDITDE
ncbi:MAG: hypothetical protein J5472_00970 [Clostridia bacterium]|jgi:hypothetical protein|nr:hypothetical protein [Clostridia bacterium]